MQQPFVDRKYAYFCGGLCSIALLIFLIARYLILDPLPTGKNGGADFGPLLFVIYLIFLPGFGAAVAMIIGTFLRGRVAKQTNNQALINQIVARKTVLIFSIVLSFLLAFGFKNIFDQKNANTVVENLSFK